MGADNRESNDRELLFIFLQILMTVKFDVYIRNSIIIRSLYDTEVRMQLLSVSRETIDSIFKIKNLLEKNETANLSKLLSSIFYEFNASVSADTTLENMITTYVCSNILNDFCKFGLKKYSQDELVKKLETDQDMISYGNVLAHYIEQNLSGHTITIDTLSMWARKLISDVTFLFRELSRHIKPLHNILGAQQLDNNKEHGDTLEGREKKSELSKLYDNLMKNHSERTKRIGFNL